MVCVIIFYFINALCIGIHVFIWRGICITWVREGTKLLTVGASGMHSFFFLMFISFFFHLFLLVGGQWVAFLKE